MNTVEQRVQSAATVESARTKHKFALQDNQYRFPYHYLPHVSTRGVPMRTRGLSWGFEYLCYQLHLVERVRAMQPQSLLEVGCGDGRFVGMLDEVERRVGVDLSEPAIRFARAFHPSVDFRNGPMSTLREVFDVVVAIEVLEHVPDEEINSFLYSLAERVSPSGRILISVPSEVVPVHPKHYRHYNEKLLRSQIERSRAPVSVLSIEDVYAPPAWLDLALRYTCNPFLVFELRPLNRLLWKYVWEHARFASPGTGRHIVATLARSHGVAE